MIKISDLIKIGFSDLMINLKVASGDIKIIDDSIEVLNASYYDEIFFRCINDKDTFKLLIDCIDDIEYKKYYLGIYELCYGDFRYGVKLINSCDVDSEELVYIRKILSGEIVENVYPRYNDQLGNFVELLDKYINTGNYPLCDNVFELIMTYDNNFYLSALRMILNNFNDYMIYIVDPSVYRNKCVLDNYRALERKLLFKIEIGLYEDVYKLLDLLKDLYQDQVTLSFDVISMFLNKIRMLANNRRMLSYTNEMGVMGDVDSVLVALLSENDFYRSIEVVETKLYREPNNIKYIIYNKLTDIMRYYLYRNNEFVNAEMECRTVSDITIEEIVAPYPLSSIKGDIMSNVEDTNEEYIDDNINYYEVYRYALGSKDYKGALDAIRKFQLKLKRLGSTAKFDYIEKDMMIRIQNSTNHLEFIKKYEHFLGLANKERKEGNFEDAIVNYYNAFKYCIKRNPVVLCKVAECYVGLNDLDSAIKMYDVALEDFMYPEDILKFMDVLLKNEEYERVIEVAQVYEDYYPLDNPKVHYMLSISYLHLGLYPHAIGEIWNVENINDELYGVKYELKYEADIIERLKSGEEVVPYNMSTFIDFEMNDYDKRIKKRYAKYESVVTDPLNSIFSTIGTDEDTFENKMKYLFSLLKIFVIDNNEVNAKRIYTFIGDFIEKGNISLEDKNKFTLSLKNYRNL